MSRPHIVIWGASGHARVVADIIERQGDLVIAGFLDDLNLERRGTEFCGYRVLGGREQLSLVYDAGVEFLIVAIGDNRARMNLGRLGETSGFTLATIIHPTAVVAEDTVIGRGTVIKALASIDPDVNVGMNVIISACVSIGHGCAIGSAVRISGGVHIAGETIIGDRVSIATGATVRDRITIGTGSFIGVGSVVVSDIPAGVIAYGNPARIIRSVMIDDSD